jgi:hypothetical protein
MEEGEPCWSGPAGQPDLGLLEDNHHRRLKNAKINAFYTPSAIVMISQTMESIHVKHPTCKANPVASAAKACEENGIRTRARRLAS